MENKPTYCGADCSACAFKDNCRGCAATDGCPFGSQCFAAKFIKEKGIDAFEEYKKSVIDEINSLNIAGMKKVEKLFMLAGSFVNLEYTLDNGQKVKFLNDSELYLGAQLEGDNGRCFGVVANERFILVCTYGAMGENPELVLYTKR